MRPGVYLVGARLQALEVDSQNNIILADKLVSLEDYIMKFGLIECLMLDKVMRKQSLTFS